MRQRIFHPLVFSVMLVFSVILSIGGALIFVLPWQIPPTKRVFSVSYDAGFNNMLSILGVVLTILALCALRFFRARTSQDNLHNALEKLLQTFPEANTRGDKTGLGVLCFLHALAIAAWFWILPYSYFGEMTYMLSRVDLILLGQMPYRDFHFIYGPLFLYLPVALVRISGNFLGPDQAYVISLIIFTIAGISAVFYVLNAFNFAPKHKRILFLILIFSGFNLSMGVNYTFVRFVLPYFLLLALHRKVSASRPVSESRPVSASSPAERPLSLARWFFGTALAGALTFWISPETGIAFACAISVYCWMQFKTNGLKWRLSGVFAMLAAIASLGVFASSYLTGFLAFGGGGNNFPVYPSLPVLFFLMSILTLVPIMTSGGKERPSPLALALATIMVVMVAPVLGRGDSGHIFFNGLGVFVFSIALLSTLSRRFFAVYTVSLVLIFGLYGKLVAWIQYSAPMLQAIAMRQNGMKKINRNFLASATNTTSAPDATSPALQELSRALAPYRKIGTPLGCAEDVEMLLKSQGLYVAEHHPMPYQEIVSEANMARKLADIRQMPMILVPRQTLQIISDNGDHEKPNAALLSILLMYPVSYAVRSTPLAPKQEARIFVRQNFTPVREIGDYLVMKRTIKR